MITRRLAHPRLSRNKITSPTPGTYAQLTAPSAAAVLEALTDSELETRHSTNWGEWWPCHGIFTTLIREQVHHGAEIGLLRDLYRNRETLGDQDHG